VVTEFEPSERAFHEVLKVPSPDDANVVVPDPSDNVPDQVAVAVLTALMTLLMLLM
jgi:hypothetical protein